MDHIQPVSLGGSSDLENLCAACDRCNLSKQNFTTCIDPESKTEVILLNPREQLWSEHFAWSEDGTGVIGLSATGRATIARLNMNHMKQQTRRALWVKFGIHPPPQ